MHGSSKETCISLCLNYCCSCNYSGFYLREKEKSYVGFLFSIVSSFSYYFHNFNIYHEPINMKCAPHILIQFPTQLLFIFTTFNVDFNFDIWFCIFKNFPLILFISSPSSLSLKASDFFPQPLICSWISTCFLVVVISNFQWFAFHVNVG